MIFYLKRRLIFGEKKNEILLLSYTFMKVRKCLFIGNNYFIHIKSRLYMQYVIRTFTRHKALYRIRRLSFTFTL